MARATSNSDIPRQRAVIDQMLLSSAFTQAEVDDYHRWEQEQPRTYHDYSGKFEWARSRLLEETQKRKDSMRRKEVWYRARGRAVPKDR